jgi:hypothetical protein
VKPMRRVFSICPEGLMFEEEAMLSYCTFDNSEN